MIELFPHEIADAADARLLAGDPGRRAPADAPARAVVDSRQVGPGDLFFGLPGERHDGGAFAEQAIAEGAWGVVVAPEHARRVAESLGGAAPGIAPLAPVPGAPGTGDDGPRMFSAADPLAALAGLARRWLGELGGGGCRVAGITGSTGKTSTKDILVSLLRPPLGDRVHANRENYNTEIGLPLTVLEAPRHIEALVLEMAMRGMGQIRALARIASPEVGVITNVGPVHLELVGTIERVAEAKAELIAELPSGGTCVVPAAEEALHPHLRPDVRTLTFANWTPGTGSAGGAGVAGAAEGESAAAGYSDSLDAIAGAAADVRVLRVERSVGGIHAEVAVGSERGALEFNFRQAHNLVNALAAIGAAHALGFPLEALAEGAGRISFSSLRGEEVLLADGVLLVNDCYNANPMSMRAALDHLAELAAEKRPSARAVAVLGDMRELGSEAAAFHRGVGTWAARAGVSVLVAVGDHAPDLAAGFGSLGEVVSVADAAQAAEAVADLVRSGDLVLVKGSRSVGLERVAEALDPVRGGAA